MLSLLELEPSFIKRNSDTNYEFVDDVNLADGLIFLCPVCFVNNAKSKIGVHSIICWKPNVPQTTSPTPGRWNMLGTGFNDLTLQAGSSSILLTSGCNAHFFIREGQITNG